MEPNLICLVKGHHYVPAIYNDDFVGRLCFNCGYIDSEWARRYDDRTQFI